MNKNIMFMFALLIVMGLASASDSSLPNPIRINDCVQLKAGCDNCTFINLTGVDYPNQSIVINGSFAMEQVSQTLWQYNFCTTPVPGQYTYHTIGDLNGLLTSKNPSFEVNAQGLSYDSTQGTIYLAMFILLIGFFILSAYWVKTIPFSNGRTEEGVFNVNWNKYYKIGAFMLCWVIFIGISYFAWNLSYGILQFTEMANFFYFIFRTSFILMFPAFVLVAVISFVVYLKDKKLEEMIRRNLTIR